MLRTHYDRPRQGAANSLPLVGGFAGKYKSFSRAARQVRESWGEPLRYGFAPGAFDDVVKSQQVIATVEHDESLAHRLGDIASGALKLSVGALGLHVSLQPPPTLAGRALVQGIRAGRLGQLSMTFQWRADDEYFAEHKGERVVVITKLATLSEITFCKEGLFATRAWVEGEEGSKFKSATLTREESAWIDARGYAPRPAAKLEWIGS